MDVTFVLEESGATTTVAVPCETTAAAAKEAACMPLAVLPASVEMRIGTEVVEGTCRLQDTAFGEGMQVVLACRFAKMKCPAEYSAEGDWNTLSLSRCGTLCVFTYYDDGRTRVKGFCTETFNTAFAFTPNDAKTHCPPAISQCKTRCYLPCTDGLLEVALPGGEVLRKVDGESKSVFACGSVVVSQGKDDVSVYDEDLTLLRSLTHQGCCSVAVSQCGGWALTSSSDVRLWDVNTGIAVACVPAVSRVDWFTVALSRTASVFAVECEYYLKLFDWGGTLLSSEMFIEKPDTQEGGNWIVLGMQFTPCGKYLLVNFRQDERDCVDFLHQYDVATGSKVRHLGYARSFAISPCGRVVVLEEYEDDVIVTKYLYPYE